MDWQAFGAMGDSPQISLATETRRIEEREEGRRKEVREDAKK